MPWRALLALKVTLLSLQSTLLTLKSTLLALKPTLLTLESVLYASVIEWCGTNTLSTAHA